MYRTAVRCLGAVLLCVSAAQALSATGPVPGQSGPAQSASSPQTPAGPVFDVLEYQVEGNTVLGVESIETALTPFLGPDRQMDSPDGVEAARGALEKAYQNAGYLTVFVDVPEQRIEAGVVVLRVTEGKVGRLSVTGSHYFSQGYIRSKVPELAEGNVPNFNEVQRQLALLNRTEDRRVQPVLRAGVVPGSVDADLKVEDHLPLAGTAEINDRHAPNTTPLRASLNVRYDNLWQREHSISLTAVTSPQAFDESRVLSLNYTIPDDDQSAWTGYVVNSNSSVSAIGGVNVLGKGTTFGLRYLRPLASGAAGSQSLTLGVDYKDIQQVTGAGDAVVSTPLRYLPFLAAYSGSAELTPHSQTSLYLQLVTAARAILQRNVDGCPGGSADQFACNRQGGDGSFATVRADLRHDQPLGDIGSMHLRLGGQVASGPLPSAEQYAIGGADTVRGYLEAEAVGDHAVLGSAEWHSTDLATRWSNWVGDDSGRMFSRGYALAFVDVARAYTSDPAAGQAPHASLAGAGIGLRSTWHRSLTTEMDLAWPLKSSQASISGSPRLHIRLAIDL